MAFDYRQQFKKDVVIDMICYRRHGHNEGDDPSYTQPMLYRKIKEHPSVARCMRSAWCARGCCTQADVRRAPEGIHWHKLSAAYDLHEAERARRYELQESRVDCRGIRSTSATAITAGTGRRHRRHHDVPRGFPSASQADGSSSTSAARSLPAAPMDWAFGEALAFGSLVLEGTPVRLSGQDSGRGTFSQRHLAFYDSKTGDTLRAAAAYRAGSGAVRGVDSSLSEYAVLGFEFGYSVGRSADAGDVGGAVRRFRQRRADHDRPVHVCGGTKWGQPGGLVMLLPHGYEGQGPEHSSARIERFLQLCAENNMQVGNCTTPAQYFHLLRRQMRGGADGRPIRKPLIVFTPKSAAASEGRLALWTTSPPAISRGDRRRRRRSAERSTRVLFCSGKVYYDLLAGRDAAKGENVAIVRMEQMYPFPQAQIEAISRSTPAHCGGLLGAGRASQHGSVAIHVGSCNRCSTGQTNAALCRPARKRESSGGNYEAARAGAVRAG